MVILMVILMVIEVFKGDLRTVFHGDFNGDLYNGGLMVIHM